MPLGFDPNDPFWTVMITLGNGANAHSVTEALKRYGKVRLVKTPDLAMVENLNAGKISRDAVYWKPEVLHKATLQILNSPLASTVHQARMSSASYHYDPDRLSSAARWAAYQNNERAFLYAVKHSSEWFHYFAFVDADWLLTRSGAIRSVIAGYCCKIGFLTGNLPDKLLPLFGADEASAYLVAVAYGDHSKAEAIARASKAMTAAGFVETAWFLAGRAQEAHQAFVKRCARRKTSPLYGISSIFARLAAMRVGDLAAATSYIYGESDFPGVDQYIKNVIYFIQNPSKQRQSWLPFELQSDTLGLPLCIAGALESLIESDMHPDRSNLRAHARESAKSRGLWGFHEQLLEVAPAQRSALHWGHGLVRLESWEFALQTLRNRGSYEAPPEKKEQLDRLAWRLDGEEPEPLRVKLSKKGWSTGTRLSWKTLFEKPPDFLTEQDRVALGKVHRSNEYGHWETSLDAPFWKALVGHPMLFYKGEPCELVEVPLALKLTRVSKTLEIATEPYFGNGSNHKLVTLSPGKLGLVVPDSRQLELARLLQTPLRVPESARERLLEGLEPWLDRVEIRYGKGVDPLIATQAGDATLRVQLMPYRDGLKIALRVRPLGIEGPLFRSGEGPAQESLRWKNRPILVLRDLAAEAAGKADLLAACPALFEGDDQEFPEAEEALEVLLQLQSSGFALEWPEKKPWKVRAAVSTRQLSLQAEGADSWFTLRGELRVDETLVVGLARLLELHRDSKGRFVQLEDGQFVALSEDLKARLAAVDELVEAHKKELRLSPLAVPSLAELDESIDVDSAFKKCLERFRSATTYQARVPSTLKAELRDYQRDGYRWMAQRAKTGAGVCLADDMGLGKTVQAIAVLLKEAPKGPQLVLCPTSVTSNWNDQIGRFAPELRPLYWEGKNRVALTTFGPYDVILCSYRMLLQDRLGLKDVAWRSVILDEAQFIKNPESKTARAVFELAPPVRIATTGTPIENRLSELWSIFRFLNPGLLGTLPSFRRRFEGPVLAGQSGPRQRLRRLVSPFILRRTKTQVLTELPSRTEIAINVELGEEERALYEETRRKAAANLSEAAGQLQLLASLTRLRQACCHPQLILPEEKFTSSKFETFFALASDLLAGNHRALVFSQFVGLLKLLEVELKARGMSYLYLDGSTPVTERRQLVDNFQAGEGDFFLISLKAGGTGLNLTGADYVIHLDPWWNPAAEDQASDRAHRIGQTRPVTIYRLIAKDTIEEKVVKLQELKRELAQGVLEGADGQSQLSSKDLFELLGS